MHPASLVRGAAVGLSLLTLQAPVSAQGPMPGQAVGSLACTEPNRAAIAFVPNHGQWPARALARARATGMCAWLAEDALVLDLAGPGDARCTVEIGFVGGRADHGGLEAVGRAKAVHNYYCGPAERWRLGVPVHAGLVQHDLWPGVDLVLRDATGKVAYDLRCADDVALAAAVFEVRGAEALLLDGDGSLRVRTAFGDLAMSPPVSWRDHGGDARMPATSGFRVLGGNRFGFTVEGHQPGVRLVVDPVLHWGTFAGGTGDDTSMDVAPSVGGAVTIAGTTRSSNFPTSVGPAQGTFGGGSWDAFVSRFDPAQSGAGQLVWSTYLGGNGDDAALVLREHAANGRLWLAGYSSSTDAPATANAFQPTNGGGRDGFVASLDAQGHLHYASCFGGTGDEHCNTLRIAHDGTTATFAGYTQSPNLPVSAGAFQPNFGGDQDAFVARLATSQPAASQLAFGTYLGGPGHEGNTSAVTTPWNFQDGGLVVDGNGRVTFAGDSNGGFPTTLGAYQPGYLGTAATTNITVTQLDPCASGAAQLLWSTYVGGSTGFNEPYAMDRSPRGTLVFGGLSYDSTFPTTTGAFRETMDPSLTTIATHDAVIAELSPDGAHLLYSTFVGGSNDATGGRIVVESSGTVLCAGFTRALLPVTTGARTPARLGTANDCYVARFDLRGQGDADLLHLTYFGGSGGEGCWGIAPGIGGAVWITGTAASTNLPVSSGAFQTTNLGGPRDGWVARVDLLPVGVERIGSSSPGCERDYALLPAGGASLAANDFGVCLSGAPAWRPTLVFVGALRNAPVTIPGLQLVTRVGPAIPTVRWTDCVGALRLPLPLGGATLGLQFGVEAWTLGGCAPIVGSDALAVTVQL